MNVWLEGYSKWCFFFCFFFVIGILGKGAVRGFAFTCASVYVYLLVCFPRACRWWEYTLVRRRSYSHIKPHASTLQYVLDLWVEFRNRWICGGRISQELPRLPLVVERHIFLIPRLPPLNLSGGRHRIVWGRPLSVCHSRIPTLA